MRTLEPLPALPDGAARAAAAFAAGEPVLVGDPGDQLVVLAVRADRIDGVLLARVQELAGGITLLGLDESELARLALAPLGDDRRELPLELTAPVDAAGGGVAGGWSAEDRARTMQIAADPGTGAGELAVPGHVQIAAVGPTATPAAAAALALARRAGGPPAVVLGVVSEPDGSFASLADARLRPGLSSLAHVSSAVIRGDALHRESAGRLVECALPTREGEFRAVALDAGPALDTGHGTVLAVIHGEPAELAAPLIHVHHACLLGDAFGSGRCGCAAELAAAQDAVLAAGAGVIVYVKPGVEDPGRRFHCGAEAPVDRAPVLALLSACGVTPPAGPPSGDVPTARWFTRDTTL